MKDKKQRAAEQPLLFSAPMILAILAGRKTETRRLVGDVPEPPAMDSVHPANPLKHAAPYLDAYCSERKTEKNPRGMSTHWCWWTRDDRQCLPTFNVRYQPGDIVWVRENFRAEELEDGKDGIRYLADNTFRPIEPTMEAAEQWGKMFHYGRKRPSGRIGNIVPSIHMPRWASRITLEVTGVRVERLQDITEGAAVAEGVVAQSPRLAFEQLWNRLHGPEAWDANPWVRVTQFRRIDQ